MPDDKLDGGGPPQLICSKSPWQTVKIDGGFMSQTRLCKADERRGGQPERQLSPLHQWKKKSPTRVGASSFLIHLILPWIPTPWTESDSPSSGYKSRQQEWLPRPSKILLVDRSGETTCIFPRVSDTLFERKCQNGTCRNDAELTKSGLKPHGSLTPGLECQVTGQGAHGLPLTPQTRLSLPFSCCCCATFTT